MLAPWDNMITVELANRSIVFERLDAELNKRTRFENAYTQSDKWEKLEKEVKNMKLASTPVYHFAKASEEKRAKHGDFKKGLQKEIRAMDQEMSGMQRRKQLLVDCKKMVERRVKKNGAYKVYLQSVVDEDTKNFKSPRDVVKQAQSYMMIRDHLLVNISELQEAILEGTHRLAWIDCWKMLVNTRLSNEMSRAWTRQAQVRQDLAGIERYFADASEKQTGRSTLSARMEACVANIHGLLVEQLKIPNDPGKPVKLATQLEEMPKLLAELKKMAVIMRSDYIGESDEGFQGPSTASNCETERR